MRIPSQAREVKHGAGKPIRIVADHSIFGEQIVFHDGQGVRSGRADQVESILGWLASSILWIGLALPELGLLIRTIPSPGLPMLWMLAVIVLMWGICGWLMTKAPIDGSSVKPATPLPAV